MMKVDLLSIQSLADNASREDMPVLDFPIPPGCGDYTKWMEIKTSNKGGKGFFAITEIKAGTLLIASKPISLIMDWEVDYDDDENLFYEEEQQDEEEDHPEKILKGSKRNGMLVVKLLRAIKNDPLIWFNEIDKLYPREITEDLPFWVCESSEVDENIDKHAEDLKNSHHNSILTDDIVDEIRQRLPLIVKYNCLSVETGPELFVHPNQAQGGHVKLSSTGLYHEPSFFNHHSRPNVSRYAIGDVMFFVTNQQVSKDEELCISYIPGDLLMESSEIRSRLLDMDFEDESNNYEEIVDINKKTMDAKKEFPIIDINTQDDLMSLDPLERLHEIIDLLNEVSKGTIFHEGDDGQQKEISFFKCDEHQLRILLALTYESLGSPSKALEEWKRCVTFVEKYYPHHDENGVALKVQAAISSFLMQDLIGAKLFAASALESHNLLFGGGVSFFLKRYSNELKLHLRPSPVTNAIEFLWPN